MTVILILVILLVLYLLLTLALARVSCGRKKSEGGPMKEMLDRLDAQSAACAAITAPARKWLAEQTAESVAITAEDGVKLFGSFYENPAAQGVLIAFHGFRSNGVHDFGVAVQDYWRRGFSVLLVEQRGTNRSGGKWITYGQKERRDLLGWCEYITRRCPDKKLLLAGLSMGASTVMMASDSVPETVAGIIADCGFDSPLGEIAYTSKELYHLNAKPMFPGMMLWARLLGHFSFREITASEALAHAKAPVLFVHGEADSFVPPENVHRCYDACTAKKFLFTVPDADHGMSFLGDYAGYIAALDEFLALCGFAVTAKAE